jgi:hypothetical protein
MFVRSRRLLGFSISTNLILRRAIRSVSKEGLESTGAAPSFETLRSSG